MASVTIRNLDDGVKAALAAQASSQGRSLEEHLRRTLASAAEAAPGNALDPRARAFASLLLRAAAGGKAGMRLSLDGLGAAAASFLDAESKARHVGLTSGAQVGSTPPLDESKAEPGAWESLFADAASFGGFPPAESIQAGIALDLAVSLGLSYAGSLERLGEAILSKPAGCIGSR